MSECKILNDSAESLRLAASMLRAGELVAFPTETVYGLGANALLPEAVAAIYAAKGRPGNNPLIVHVSSMAQAKQYGQWNEWADSLSKKFWPGALTLVMTRTEHCPLADEVSAGGATVALRMPIHPIAQDLLGYACVPIAAPSANPSGAISPTQVEHVVAHLRDKIAAVVDGGMCDVGVESTVVDISGEVPLLLRPGSVTWEQLQAVMPEIEVVSAVDESAPMASPGMLTKHYAPNASVRLNATDVREGEALLAFGTPLSGAEHMFQLSASGDLEEAAERLFEGLHALDALAKRIAVMPIPDQAVGRAINDRLRRAAA